VRREHGGIQKTFESGPHDRLSQKLDGLAERGTPADRVAGIAVRQLVLRRHRCNKTRRQFLPPAIALNLVTLQILTFSSRNAAEAQLSVVLLAGSREGYLRACLKRQAYLRICTHHPEMNPIGGRITAAFARAMEMVCNEPRAEFMVRAA
jgi:hypothetical protein